MNHGEHGNKDMNLLSKNIPSVFFVVSFLTRSYVYGSIKAGRSCLLTHSYLINTFVTPGFEFVTREAAGGGLCYRDANVEGIAKGGEDARLGLIEIGVAIRLDPDGQRIHPADALNIDFVFDNLRERADQIIDGARV